MTHRFSVRVYYEDTDLAGIVYYANYLKFIERGRSEWLRSLGIDQSALRAATGIVFAVRRVEADYLRPAVFDDLLEVRTALDTLTPARLVLRQTVLRHTKLRQAGPGEGAEDQRDPDHRGPDQTGFPQAEPAAPALLFDSRVTLVALTAAGRAARLPEAVRQAATRIGAAPPP